MFAKHSLYPHPLVPSYAYISKSALSGLPTVFIDAGIHGNEIAPIISLIKSANILTTLSKTIGIVYIPICNPVGYKNNARYIDNNSDWKQNIHSVGDMSHILGWQDNNKWRPASGEPNNPYAKHLSEFIYFLSNKINISLILDLHEDDHQNLPPGGYIYPIGKTNSKITNTILQLFTTQNIALLTNVNTRFGEKIIDGQVLSPANASLPELVQHLNPNSLAYTIETTTSLPLLVRKCFFTSLINNIPELIFSKYI